MQARPLTESSFILATDAGERFGLLVKKENEIELITSETKNIFSDVAALEELFGDSIHFLKPLEHKEAENLDVSGYPVKHEEIFEIDESSEFTTYKSSPNSRVRWVPGWWAIRFTREYICFLCPKLSTLSDNEFMGPFKTRFDASHAAKIKNQQLRDQDDLPGAS